MSAASNAVPPQHIHDEHCPTCGAGVVNWGRWSNAVKKPDLRIKVTDSAGQEYEYGTQQARFVIVLNEAGIGGVSKAQLPGLHVGHYAQQLRLDGLACTTTMIPTKWPWAGKYGLYRLEEPVTIQDITDEYRAEKVAKKAAKKKRKPDKTKPAQGNERASNPNSKLMGIEGISDG